MARLIDPVIADLQAEHAQALRDGRMWRSRWVRLAGYIAFAKVFVMCEWSPVDDRRPLIRAVGFSLCAIAIVTTAFVGLPYRQLSRVAETQLDAWRVVMFLVPQALALSIPIGLIVGMAIGLARQKVSVRLATAVATIGLVCSIGSVANIGWLTPNANQAFRTTLFRRISEAPLAKGETELTFAELDRLIERRRAFPVGSYEWDSANRLRTGYHTRWALACAALVLTLFAMSLVACTHRRWKIAAGVVVALAGYYALLYVGRLFALNHELAPPIAAWLPNVVLILTAAALQRLNPEIKTSR
jgi:lipopolysaccharide export LptBFGC system permease protein LptF